MQLIIYRVVFTIWEFHVNSLSICLKWSVTVDAEDFEKCLHFRHHLNTNSTMSVMLTALRSCYIWIGDLHEHHVQVSGPLPVVVSHEPGQRALHHRHIRHLCILPGFSGGPEGKPLPLDFCKSLKLKRKVRMTTTVIVKSATLSLLKKILVTLVLITCFFLLGY